MKVQSQRAHFLSFYGEELENKIPRNILVGLEVEVLCTFIVVKKGTTILVRMPFASAHGLFLEDLQVRDLIFAALGVKPS